MHGPGRSVSARARVLSERLITKDSQELLAVAIELGLPNATDVQHLRRCLRSIGEHLLQRLVMEDDIGGHVVLARERLPARA